MKIVITPKLVVVHDNTMVQLVMDGLGLLRHRFCTVSLGWSFLYVSQSVTGNDLWPCLLCPSSMPAKV